MRYGSIPAGGLGTRLQPLGFSKELAPIRRRAVIEYLVERLVTAGIDKIFINTAEDKYDLIRYLSTKSIYRDHFVYLVRERKGLLDGIVMPEQFLRPEDELYFGLPDTIWYPKDGFAQLDKVDSELVLGLFDTGTPERFDSVVIDDSNRVKSIEVKVNSPKTKWTWAIGKMTVAVARKLRQYEAKLKLKPGEFGLAMDAYAKDSLAKAIELPGSSCLDTGTPEDFDKADQYVKDHEK